MEVVTGGKINLQNDQCEAKTCINHEILFPLFA